MDSPTNDVPPCASAKKDCAGRGRPRSVDAEGRILEAAFDLLVKRGWDKFTMEGVACQAGVGKATVYRWWPDRNTLAVDSFIARGCSADSLPNTGCLQGDLHEQIVKVIDFLTGEHGNALRGVFAAVQEQPELLDKLESHWSPIREESMRAMADLAIKRGQLPAGTDAPLMFKMVFGPVLMGVFWRKEMTPEQVSSLVTRVLASFDFRHESPASPSLDDRS